MNHLESFLVMVMVFISLVASDTTDLTIQTGPNQTLTSLIYECINDKSYHKSDYFHVTIDRKNDEHDYVINCNNHNYVAQLKNENCLKYRSMVYGCKRMKQNETFMTENVEQNCQLYFHTTTKDEKFLCSIKLLSDASKENVITEYLMNYHHNQAKKHERLRRNPAYMGMYGNQEFGNAYSPLIMNPQPMYLNGMASMDSQMRERRRSSGCYNSCYFPSCPCEESVQIPIPCPGKPCKNNAVCVVTKRGLRRCRCTRDHYGMYCEARVYLRHKRSLVIETHPFCKRPKLSDHSMILHGTHPFIPGTTLYTGCKHGYRAAGGADRIICDTDGVWRGDMKVCEEIDICASEKLTGFSVCSNGGTCVNLGKGEFRCTCPKTYIGDRCQHRVNPCHPDPCAPNGICDIHPPTKTFTCKCNAGWLGNQCEKPVSTCALNRPCLNKGKCVPTLMGYRCKCVEPYFGEHCSKIMDTCALAVKEKKHLKLNSHVKKQILAGIYCHNNGKCIVSKKMKPKCICDKWSTGSHCHNKVKV
ncbi:hypothetical protein SNEBB_003873 [Seison nebaliae]|nr:hypothetical protein SNEBB_003873 [Seison nebaliae]